MKESGISLIEILISILISSILLISSNKVFSFVFTSDLSLNKERSRVKNILKINHILSKIVKDTEIHPFKIDPRVQSGSLKYTDGTSHAFEKRVNQSSDVLTYGEFIFNDLLKIKEKEEGLVNIKACEVFDNGRFTKSKYKSFVGITNSYFYELKIISIAKLSTRPDCYLFSFFADKSLLFKSDFLSSAKHVNYLLPIKSLYTILLDKNFTLRYLSTIQGSVRENQPIKNSFFTFKINSSLHKLSLKSSELSLNFHFIKQSSLNTTLNLSEFKNE